jgi:hypothetical protein
VSVTGRGMVYRGDTSFAARRSETGGVREKKAFREFRRQMGNLGRHRAAQAFVCRCRRRSLSIAASIVYRPVL